MDATCKSFIFALANPQNLPAIKYALKAENEKYAIECDSKRSLFFPGEFAIYDQGRTNTESCPLIFGRCHSNDSKLDRDMLLTVSKTCQVREMPFSTIVPHKFCSAAISEWRKWEK
jgi:hypothetical protein